ncbi:MAG: DNA polymerase III subunit [Mediterranea sp.]|jgi:DNA polymerase-3 subunit delta'|nr:DNA polymerase III subunit [Mediterranea sp.]
MLFKDIIGQQALKQRLITEVNEGRIPHAQLFCGPEGAGKLPLAIAYARYIACSNRGETDACGTCPSCVKFNKLAHPDLHFSFPVVKKGSSDKIAVSDDYIGQWRSFVLDNPYFTLNHWIDAIGAENKQAWIYSRESDEITKKLSLKASEGGYKFCIIWLPERMYKDNAFGNKMLKLLEEPPAKTLFLLVSEAPEMMLQTILSRTQRINIPPIEEAAIAQALEDKFYVPPTDSAAIAHLANGNFIRALETIHLSEENQLFLDLFINLMRLSYQRKIKEMKLWSEKVAAMGRERQKNLLDYCQRMIRENFIYNFHRPDLVYLTREEQQFSSRFAPFVNERNVMGIVDELSEAQLHIGQNVNPKMVFFDFALKMIVLLKQ